jgi:hypothetical protein
MRNRPASPSLANCRYRSLSVILYRYCTRYAPSDQPLTVHSERVTSPQTPEGVDRQWLARGSASGEFQLLARLLCRIESRSSRARGWEGDPQMHSEVAAFPSPMGAQPPRTTSAGGSVRPPSTAISLAFDVPLPIGAEKDDGRHQLLGPPETPGGHRGRGRLECVVELPCLTPRPPAGSSS